MAPLTRSKGGGVALHSGLEVKRNVRGPYPYLALKAKDEKAGFSGSRFVYQRNTGRRIYFPAQEDMPKPHELQFPSFAAEHEKKAAVEKYKKANVAYLPKNKRATYKVTNKYFWITVLENEDSQSIPQVLNRHITWALLGTGD